MGRGGGMVKVLLFPGVEGGGSDLPSVFFVISPPFLFVGLTIGGLTIGGLTIGGLLLLLIPTGAFTFFILGFSGVSFELTTSLSSTSAGDSLDFPNILKKLLAKLPASLAVGVANDFEGNEDLIGADFVLEGKLRALSFCI